MKVISLMEPWGSLIKEKKKYIETRSWKTNYRGELYIHTSSRKVSKKEQRIQQLITLLEDSNFQYGAIIAKCKLVDCIYMENEWIQELKKQSPIEYLCGEYQVGRYAWILEEIESLKDPIWVKGHLGIWNVDIN